MDEIGGRTFRRGVVCGVFAAEGGRGHGDPLSKEQMNVRTMTRGFYYDMAGEVAVRPIR